MCNYDWDALRTWYVEHSDCSYRELAEIFQVKEDYLRRRGAKEDWTGQRKEFSQKIHDIQIQQVTDCIADISEDITNDYFGSGKELLAKIRRAIALMDDTDVDGMRKIASSLRDLREVLHIRSVKEVAETDARIASLLAKIDQNNESDSEIVVRFADGVEELIPDA